MAKTLSRSRVGNRKVNMTVGAGMQTKPSPTWAGGRHWQLKPRILLVHAAVPPPAQDLAAHSSTSTQCGAGAADTKRASMPQSALATQSELPFTGSVPRGQPPLSGSSPTQTHVSGTWSLSNPGRHSKVGAAPTQVAGARTVASSGQCGRPPRTKALRVHSTPLALLESVYPCLQRRSGALTSVGEGVGVVVGERVGGAVGWPVGGDVGRRVGGRVGWPVGADVGRLVGGEVGWLVGGEVGGRTPSKHDDGFGLLGL